MTSEENKLIFYKNENGKIKILLKGENIRMNQSQIGELFGKSQKTISEHILNIYFDLELEEGSTMQKIGDVGNSDIGFNQITKYYNLDLIFAVGSKLS